MEWINFDPATGQGEILAPAEPDVDVLTGPVLLQYQLWVTIIALRLIMSTYNVDPNAPTMSNYIKLCNLYETRYGNLSQE